MHDPRATLTVAGLAGRVGVGPDTIRYYERIGLTQPPVRTSGGHRRYAETAVDQLLFIQGMQRLGLRLADVRELLAMRESGACPCEPAASLLRHRLRRMDIELARLTELRNELAAFVARIPAVDCPEPSPGTWRPREEVPA